MSVAKGLPGLCMLFLGSLVGCSGEAPSQPASQVGGAADEQLSWSAFCGGHDGHECSGDRVCVSFLSRSCPGPDHAGLCIPRPHHCSKVSDPVCGCDGKTYVNLCDAVAAGASVVHHGACKPPPACGAGGHACPGAGTCVRTSSGDGDDDDGDHFRSPFWGREHDERDSHSTSACECNTPQACKAGERWNDDPKVCACETNPDPCSGVTCKVGDVCVAHADGTAACVADPCSGVTCRTGDVCVVQTDGTASCVVDPCSSVTCKTGQQCVVQSDGTGACQ